MPFAPVGVKLTSHSEYLSSTPPNITSDLWPNAAAEPPGLHVSALPCEEPHVGSSPLLKQENMVTDGHSVPAEQLLVPADRRDPPADAEQTRQIRGSLNQQGQQFLRMAEFPGPGNSGQRQRPPPPEPQPPALPRPRPVSWLSRLDQLLFPEFHHSIHREFVEFFSRMSREIREELAIDKRNNLYYQCWNLLDAVAEQLQQFNREGTVLDHDWLCAQADYRFLHQSIQVAWTMDYDRHQVATNGTLLTHWEENPAHQEETLQDVMEEESHGRQFEREARANQDDLLYRQMSAEEDKEEFKGE
ncbi:hypothetical protein DL771_003243 [Monosporascus sp. 5C6A]|nr:hypothetical protein DL771_003243 [Monosporascus sp. 5C6A]